MRIFMPKEIKCGEGRFSSIPQHVFEYIRADNTQENGVICIEKGAGEKSGFPDHIFENHEVWMVDRPKDKEEFYSLMRPDRHHFGQLAVIKVKELLPEEYHFIRFHLPVISFGHLASNRELTETVIERGGTYLSLEDIVENGKRPVLAGMSKIAGEEAVRIGMRYMRDKKVIALVLVGYGNVGQAAHRIGTEEFNLSCVALDINFSVGSNADIHFHNHLGSNVNSINSYQSGRFEKSFLNEIKGLVELKLGPNTKYSQNGYPNHPLLIVLSPYKPETKAPPLITNSVLSKLPDDSVIVDVSIDQGGACEFSQITTHESPVVELERGIKYIGIPNLPGGVPKRSTPVFSESVFPYMMQIVKLGFIGALKENPALRNAVSIKDGKVTSEGLAKTFGLEHTPIETLL